MNTSGFKLTIKLDEHLPGGDGGMGISSIYSSSALCAGSDGDFSTFNSSVASLFGLPSSSWKETNIIRLIGKLSEISWGVKSIQVAFRCCIFSSGLPGFHDLYATISTNVQSLTAVR